MEEKSMGEQEVRVVRVRGCYDRNGRSCKFLEHRVSSCVFSGWRKEDVIRAKGGGVVPDNCPLRKGPMLFKLEVSDG